MAAEDPVEAAIEELVTKTDKVASPVSSVSYWAYSNKPAISENIVLYLHIIYSHVSSIISMLLDIWKIEVFFYICSANGNVS